MNKLINFGLLRDISHNIVICYNFSKIIWMNYDILMIYDRWKLI